MILVDIGNSFVHFAVEEDDKIIKNFSIQTKDFNEKILKNKIDISNEILVCSVVPKITEIFKKIKNSVVVGEDFEIPIKSLYNKRHIGMDRLVGAFAAKNIYPDCRIIIDFGTAITFDFLSKRGFYLGGFILPGIGLSLRALGNCALLPKNMKLRKKNSLIPKDTEESISRGIVSGFSLMINSLVEKYIKILKLSTKQKIVITGRDALIIKDKFKFKYIYEPFLIFKGLIILKKYARGYLKKYARG